MSYPPDHHQRYALTNELHARPFTDVEAPEAVTHFAMLVSEEDREDEREHLQTLCERYDTALPQGGASHFAVNFGAFRLKWEKHTEFTTYTFFRESTSDEPFEESAEETVPSEWLANLPGEQIVAAHISLRSASAPELTMDDLSRYFVPENLCWGSAMDGFATVITDFRIHADGFTRTLVHDHGLVSRESGRLVQRMLEYETYRNMAMLALPMARDVSPTISRIGESLLNLTSRMESIDTIEDEKTLLGELTGLSSAIERSISETSYRFGASRAYNALVEERVGEIDEKRYQHYSTLKEFVERRLAPAMRTCESVASRQLALSERATRAANLLRTSVDIKVAAQNRDLLASMNRRASMQLRLQRTVEGLSVAAITYYIVSLVGYALEGAEASGAKLNIGWIQSISIPVVALLVWLAGRRIRRHLEMDQES